MRWRIQGNLATGISQRALRRRLASLPRLHRDSAETCACKICSGVAAVFDVVDLNKWCDKDFYALGLAGIPVTYYRCRICSFIFTTFFDTWSAADFSRFIYNEDYKIVDPEYEGVRAVRTAADISGLLRGCEAARILDYGSGSGRFAAEMTARGFAQMASYDPLVAPERPRGRFDIITCFEVVEHAVDPLGTIGDMKGFLAEDGAIIIGQLLQPANIDEIRGNWWYIAPRNGHVGILADNTFAAIADRVGLDLYWGEVFYGLAQRGVSAPVRAALARLGSPSERIVRLGAPVRDDEDWYESEIYQSTDQTTVRCRWTRSAQLVWAPRPLRPGVSEIRIPFLIEITRGFAENCRVSVGNNSLPTEATATEIVARLELPASAVKGITLLTPDPVSPHALDGSPDRRKLGLLIPIAR